MGPDDVTPRWFAETLGAEIGRIADHYPFVDGAGPTTDDPAGQFVPRHMGELDVRIVSHPAVPVAGAEARGHHL